MRDFIKMEGTGNDFVIFDARQTPLNLSEDMVRRICDRHFGVGCDQLIILTSTGNADVEMVIHNADGTRAQACGNATRCVAMLLDRPYTNILVGSRILQAVLEADKTVTVNMGQPNWEEFIFERTFDYELPYNKGFAVSMGNPHLVFILDTQISDNKIIKVGSHFENHPAFPHGVNVSFINKIDSNTAVLRTWERGAGLTLACGSGACAGFAVLHRLGICSGPVIMKLRGGKLGLSIKGKNILMRGPAAEVFRGRINL